MERFRLGIVKAWRELRDSYRPELHYMRGPGPRVLAKAQTASESEGQRSAGESAASDARNAAEG